MADDEAVYSVELKDETSASAESAAAALEKLQKQIKADQDALNAMQRAMKNLQQGTSVNIDQFRSLKAQIDAKKQSIGQAQSAYLALGGGFNSAGKKGQSFKDRVAELAKTAQGVPGPIGGMVGQLGKLSGLVAGGAMVAGLVAVAAALIAVTAAAVAATVALFRFGVASANARRAEQLRLEGMMRMGAGWKGATESAKSAQAAIDKVAASSALPRDKIAGYASELAKAGLTGSDLSVALQAAAIKGAVLGDEGAKSAIKMATGIHAAGGSVDKFASDVRAKLGGVAAAQMLDLDVQMMKLQESFSAITKGLKIDAMAAALSGVTQLFSQQTASGRALKTLYEMLFQPLVDGATSALTILKRVFQGIIIAVLYVTLAFVKLQVWFKKTFGDTELLSMTTLLRAALIAIGGILAPIVILFGLLAGALVSLASPFIAVAVSMWAWLKIGKAVWDFFAETPWAELGTFIAEGIVNGLKTGAAWVMDTVKGLGDSVIKSFKETLGIASPSRVFTDLGLQIPAGVERGIEKGTSGAQDAAGGMVGAAGAAGSRGGPSIEIGSIVIQTNATDAGGIARDIEVELRRVLEGVGFALGAPT